MLRLKLLLKGSLRCFFFPPSGLGGRVCDGPGRAAAVAGVQVGRQRRGQILCADGQELHQRLRGGLSGIQSISKPKGT
eukprot:scaffold391672_cov18-Prasinocladus_malaysianus.AAC.1